MKIPLKVLISLALLGSCSSIFAKAKAASIETTPAPKGIYLLNDQHTSVDKMTLPSFLSGFTLRIGWSDLEKTKGVYDFSLIESTVTYLQAHNLKLTLEIFSSLPPAYVVSGASSTFVVSMGTVPTPWDTASQKRWSALLVALSSFKLTDSTLQRKVSLRDHPTLTAINAPVLGLQSIRDVTGSLVKAPDYDRKKFIDAISTSIRYCRDNFPHDYRFVGFFRMEDSDSANPLDEAILARLQTDYMASGKGGLGLFQEVWSDQSPDPLGLGSLLLGLKEPNSVMLQALTSWTRPFTDPTKVASGNPDAAFDSAYVNFGCRYFELYYPDIVDANLQSVFTDWAAFLATH